MACRLCGGPVGDRSSNPVPSSRESGELTAIPVGTARSKPFAKLARSRRIALTTGGARGSKDCSPRTPRGGLIRPGHPGTVRRINRVGSASPSMPRTAAISPSASTKGASVRPSAHSSALANRAGDRNPSRHSVPRSCRRARIRGDGVRAARRLDCTKGAITRFTAPAYWKFESIFLQQRVHEPPKARAERNRRANVGWSVQAVAAA